MVDHYCNCEDWPCCGHGSGAAGGGLDPEDAEAWLEGLGEDRDFAESYMVPCRNCGEMRPKDDPSIVAEGICYMCQGDPQRGLSEQASRNLTYFRQREQAKDDTIAQLEDQNAELEAENRKLRAALRRRGG